MSRIAKQPVPLPKGVEFKLSGRSAIIKGAKGSLSLDLHKDVLVSESDGELQVALKEKTTNKAIGGTTRSLLANMVTGVSAGLRAQAAL